MQRYGPARAVHPDETSPADVAAELVPMLDGIPGDTSSTVLLLTSPQKLATEIRVRETLLRCAGRGTLRLIALDEAHRYAAHGRSFRDSVRYLRDEFFLPLFGAGSVFRVACLAMTATMSTDLLRLRDLSRFVFLGSVKRCSST